MFNFPAVSPDFDLVFPEPSVSNYVLMRLRLNGSSLLRQVSVCTWMRTADVRNYGTAWSYSAENNWLSADSANVLTAYDYGNLQVWIFCAAMNVAFFDLNLILISF